MGYFSRTASVRKTSFFSLPAISTSESSMSHSHSDSDAVQSTASKNNPSLLNGKTFSKLRNFSSRTTEPPTSDSEGSHTIHVKNFSVASISSADATTVLASSNTGPSISRPPKYKQKIGSSVARSRSGASNMSRSIKSSKKLRCSRSTASLSSKRVSRRTQRRSSKSVPLESSAAEAATTTAATAVATITPTRTEETETEQDARIKLEKDMLLLADAIHLDNNTKMMLASYDAKTVEDFFMMGDADFHHLLARARNDKRGLPPLQIRKVRILREWITELVESTHPDLPYLPCLMTSKMSSTGRSKTALEEVSLLPSDWKRRFYKDLPTLKKKLRRKGNSFSEVFPWLSYLINFRESLCGSRF